jgi:hypothetical protein
MMKNVKKEMFREKVIDVDYEVEQEDNQFAKKLREDDDI